MEHEASTSESPTPRTAINNRFVRGLLIFVGTLSVVLGLIGAFLPLLPTTPFLLLAAACYARSSERLYQWLFTNRLFGTHLRNYQSGLGIPVATKVYVLVFLWAGIGTSAFLAVPDRLWWLRGLLIFVALGVTIHVMRFRTYERSPD